MLEFFFCGRAIRFRKHWRKAITYRLAPRHKALFCVLVHVRDDFLRAKPSARNTRTIKKAHVIRLAVNALFYVHRDRFASPDVLGSLVGSL